MQAFDQFRIYLTRLKVVGDWDAWTLIPVVLLIPALIGAFVYFVYTHVFAPDDRPDRRYVRRGQNLFLQSLRVIRADPETLAFSAAAAGLSLLPPALTVLMLHSERGLRHLDGIAFWFGGGRGRVVSGVQMIEGLMEISLGYLFCYFCGGLLSLGVLGCTLKRLRGGEPNFSDGVRAMSAHVAAIAEYALIGAVAGTGLTMFAPASWIGRYALEKMWTASQLYVLPSMIAENLSPVDAIKRSNELAFDSPAQDAWLLVVDELAIRAPMTAGLATFFAMLFLTVAGVLAPESSLTYGRFAELTLLPACLVTASVGMITATLYLVYLGGAYLIAVGNPGRSYEFFPTFTRRPERV